MRDDATKDLEEGIRIHFQTTATLFNLARLRSSKEVFEAIVREILYADDCALEAHIQEDSQQITDRFAQVAKNFGLTINLKKTEAMYHFKNFFIEYYWLYIDDVFTNL